MRFMSLIVLAALLTGCQGESNRAEAQTDMPPEPTTPPALEPAATTDPSEVLVEVNGKTLTRGEADAEVNNRLAAIRERVPAERIGMIQKQLFDNVVEQFIMRQILLEEASRQNITISEEEREAEFDKIRENLPAGLTIEDVIKNSPLGEERMREEVMTGIKINKLIDQQMADSLAVTDEEIDEFMAENKSRLQMPDTVHAKHILITVDEDADEETKAAKREELANIRKQIVEGADFSEMAETHSDCPSASRGGDLGTFPKGRMVPEFEEAAFSQEPGTVGEIVDTKFGYHIIKVLERNEAGEIPRERVEEMLKNRKRQEALRNYIEALKAKADIKDYRAQTAPQTPLMPQLPPPQQ